MRCWPLSALLLFAASSFLVASPRIARGQDVGRYEEPCRRLGGASLRQSIVVIDEAIVTSQPLSHETNARWTRPILEFADALGADATGRLMPKERLSIYLARRSAKDLAPVFVGCSPNMSTVDMERMREEQSRLTSFIFGSVEREARKQRESFQGALTDSFGAMRRLVGPIPKETGSMDVPLFVHVLRSLPSTIDPASGIPRILIISSMDIVDHSKIQDGKSARENGYRLASQSGLDLRRAEIYVTGVTQDAHANLQVFAEAFFLRAKGALSGWRSDGLPSLHAAPVSVKVFGGFADYGDLQAPVQLRIAVDSQGNLVNSWIEVVAGRSLASPIFGKAICRKSDDCDLKGDGRGMGQAWNPNPGERPVFDQSFAWSGMRFFEMSYNGSSGQVRIWDPSVSAVRLPTGDGGTRQIDSWKFGVRSTDQQNF